MKFEEFLAHAEAKIRAMGDTERTFAFSRTHVFNLGDDAKVNEAVMEIWDDLVEEMADRIPMPYRDTTVVTRVIDAKLGKDGWIMDRLVEIPIGAGESAELKNVSFPAGTDQQFLDRVSERGATQKFSLIRVEEGTPHAWAWLIYYYGAVDGKMIVTATPSLKLRDLIGEEKATSDRVGKFIADQSAPILKAVAAISHPDNYVVQVTPALTPKEARRVASGKTFPVAKTPHYLVLDHDVLVRLSGRQSTEHASPVPHHRRGHWMRLAERCRAARQQGLEKVWVRETYVGEREFSDARNKYVVIMDFQKKPQTV